MKRLFLITILFISLITAGIANSAIFCDMKDSNISMNCHDKQEKQDSCECLNCIKTAAIFLEEDFIKLTIYQNNVKLYKKFNRLSNSYIIFHPPKYFS